MGIGAWVITAARVPGGLRRRGGARVAEIRVTCAICLEYTMCNQSEVARWGVGEEELERDRGRRGQQAARRRVRADVATSAGRRA
jgi:hypothetical protein